MLALILIANVVKIRFKDKTIEEVSISYSYFKRITFNFLNFNIS